MAFLAAMSQAKGFRVYASVLNVTFNLENLDFPLFPLPSMRCAMYMNYEVKVRAVPPFFKRFPVKNVFCDINCILAIRDNTNMFRQTQRFC